MKNSSAKIKLVFDLLGKSVGFYSAGMLFACLASLSDMIRPKVVAYVIDNIGSKQMGSSALFMCGLLVMGVTLLAQLFKYLYQTSTVKGGEHFVKQMRDRLFEHILDMPASWHSTHQTGDMIQRCTMDVDEIKTFLSDHLINLLTMIITVVLSLIFICSQSLVLAGIAVISIPVMVLYSYWFHGGISKSFMACDEEEGRLSVLAQENLTGVRVVRAFGREAFEKEKFSKQNQTVTDKWIGLGIYLCTFWCVADMLTGGCMLAFLAAGSWLCVRGSLSVGNLIASISYLILLIQPVRNMGRVLSEMSKADVSLGRINEILSAPVEPEFANASRETEQGSSTSGTENAKAVTGPLAPPMDGDIVFDNVCFAYPEGADVLKGVSFKIKAGETLGILGSTGSGKSTIAQLITGIYDVEEGRGSISIGGVDIRNVSKSWLRSNIGMVMQEGFLFSRTIRENISIAREGLEEDVLERAVDAACPGESVNRFTDGLDTFVGERGVTLSGGQKQRAAIARTLTLETPILVFDDSLSAVDAETDAAIRRNLKKYMGNATVILISHRINTLRDADHIIVMEKGVIEEEGTHAELAAGNGIYRRVYDIQQGGVRK